MLDCHILPLLKINHEFQQDHSFLHKGRIASIALKLRAVLWSELANCSFPKDIFILEQLLGLCQQNTYKTHKH